MNPTAGLIWRLPAGRPTRVARLAGLAAGIAVVTVQDLLVLGRPNPLSYVVVLVVSVAVGRLLGAQQAATAPAGIRLWPFPIRLSPGRARAVIGLGVLTLVLGGAGALAAVGLHRLVSAVMFVSIGLSNLAWGLGSLVPEGRPTRPLGVAMFLAMAASVALRVSERL